MNTPLYFWFGFGAFVLTMMVLDLAVFHRKAHKVALREAAVWTGVWVALALVFDAVIYFWLGPRQAAEFLAGYIIEWSLSMDNVFVFSVIFSYFAVPPQYQHRVLFWGILGAVVMRLVFILAGVVLLERFHWLIYPMGGFLVLTGLKLFHDRGKQSDLSKNRVLRLARRCLPVTPVFVGEKFFVHQWFVKAQAVRVASSSAALGNMEIAQTRIQWLRGWSVTPLFLVLLVVETTDVVFAVDSIPAIFAVTRDPFILLTSNVFAILGLRALYFLLAGAMDMFRYLSIGLAAILCLVGGKMLLSPWYEIPIGLSLGVVGGILFVACLASLVASAMERGRTLSPEYDEDVPVGAHAQNVEIKA